MLHSILKLRLQLPLSSSVIVVDFEYSLVATRASVTTAVYKKQLQTYPTNPDQNRSDGNGKDRSRHPFP